MNSRLDWLVLSDYYSIYVTNAPPKARNTNRYGSYFLPFFVFMGIRMGWQSVCNDGLYFTEKRAGQTTGETVVCKPLIASVRKHE